jgi:acetyl-CoA carboxylase biotin carboxyl carrier protein
MKINESAIRKLAKLLDETGLAEIEVVEGEQVIRVSRSGVSGSHHAAPFPAAMPSDPTVPQQANNRAPATIAQEHPGAVVSPMVGTVYLAPEPNAPPFVKKGDTVKAGDTLLIIEAMKVMNPIKAEKGGTITHIMAETGKPVEFGDVLMVIE